MPIVEAHGMWWVPVRTAAKTLKVSRQRVYQLGKSGALVLRTMDGTVLVSMQSINDRIDAKQWKESAKNASRRRMGTTARG